MRALVPETRLSVDDETPPLFLIHGAAVSHDPQMVLPTEQTR